MAEVIILSKNGFPQKVMTSIHEPYYYEIVKTIRQWLHELGYSEQYYIEEDDVEDTDTSLMEVQLEYEKVLKDTEYTISWLDEIEIC